MIIKSFTGESTKDVMKLVRREMGGDAVVLKTRQLKNQSGSTQVEITACMERHTVSEANTILQQRPKPENRLPAEVVEQTASPLPPVTPDAVSMEEPVDQTSIGLPNDKETPVVVDPPAPDIAERLNGLEQKVDRLLRQNLVSPGGPTLARKFHPIATILKGADVPEEFIADFFLSRLDNYDDAQNLMEFTYRELVTSLAEMMTPSLSLSSGDRVMFFGFPGTGKSSVMGKLAAQLVTQEKQQVKLAGLDFQKVAAFEELAVYADLLCLDITDSSESTDSEAVVLIDTPAIPTDAQQRVALEAKMSETETTHRIAVVSALTRTPDLTLLAQQLRPMAPTHIAVTMLDMTRRWGAIVAAARVLQVPVVFLSDGPGGVGTIKAPDPDRLARTLLGQDICHE